MKTTYKILGIDDSINSCDCCGKQGLQKTVAILNLETGEIGHFGSTCAMRPSSCFGLEKSDMSKAISAYKARQATINAGARKLYRQRGGRIETIDTRDIKCQGGTIEWRFTDDALWTACQEEVRTQLASLPFFSQFYAIA